MSTQIIEVEIQAPQLSAEAALVVGQAPEPVTVKPKKTNRIAKGISTNDLIFSAHQGTNDDLFPQILSLYVPLGSTVADITYGKGVFWKKVETSDYVLKATDAKTGTDCGKLPYEDATID